jgi:hypothetical protein
MVDYKNYLIRNNMNSLCIQMQTEVHIEFQWGLQNDYDLVITVTSLNLYALFHNKFSHHLQSCIVYYAICYNLGCRLAGNLNVFSVHYITQIYFAVSLV